jgi:hypothetical protein
MAIFLAGHTFARSLMEKTVKKSHVTKLKTYSFGFFMIFGISLLSYFMLFPNMTGF